MFHKWEIKLLKNSGWKPNTHNLPACISSSLYTQHASIRGHLVCGSKCLLWITPVMHELLLPLSSVGVYIVLLYYNIQLRATAHWKLEEVSITRKHSMLRKTAGCDLATAGHAVLLGSEFSVQLEREISEQLTVHFFTESKKKIPAIHKEINIKSFLNFCSPPPTYIVELILS